MRLIYLSILAITLSFSMNTFAGWGDSREKSGINMYYMNKTKQSYDEVSTKIQVLCVDGKKFLLDGHNNGKAIVQMFSSSEHPMRCPKYKEE